MVASESIEGVGVGTSHAGLGLESWEEGLVMKAVGVNISMSSNPKLSHSTSFNFNPRLPPSTIPIFSSHLLTPSTLVTIINEAVPRFHRFHPLAISPTHEKRHTVWASVEG
jgi:hypothetical protein